MVARTPLRELAHRAWRSWATRSLFIGALATGLDVTVGLVCMRWLGTRGAAMAGVALGGTFTFFANRYFAFRHHNPSLGSPAVKFIIATGVAMTIHGQLVVLLHDQLAVPFVLAKLAADLGVFTVGQLFVLRYLVFPKSKTGPSPRPPSSAPPQRDSFGSSTAAS